MEINVRPSINLKSEIQIVDGTGIQSDPYILEGDIQEPENGTTLLNTRYSGEYVTFNNELYRIIGVESIDGVQLIKIRAVDSPENFKWVEFAISDHNINDNNFANYDVKADLENYYQELATTNVNDYNMIQPNTTWYLGTVAEGGSYKTSICEIAETNISTSTCEKTKATTTANIGLVRLGEMFASVIDRTAAGSYDSWTLTGSYFIRCK